MSLAEFAKWVIEEGPFTGYDLDGSDIHEKANVGKRLRPLISDTTVREIMGYDEESCPGHVATPGNPKVCVRCGVHIDSLRLED